MSTIFFNNSKSNQAETQTQSLNRYVVLNPNEDFNSHLWGSRLSKAGSVAVVVGFTGAAVIGNLALTIFAPAYFPVSLALAIAFAPAVVPVAKNLLEKGRQYDRALEIDKKIIVQFEKLKKMSSSSVKKDLAKMGIQKADLKKNVKLKELYPVIARAKVWTKRPAALQKEAERLAKAAKKAKDPAVKKEELREAVKIKFDKARVAKIRAAYFYGLITQPKMNKSFDKVCKINDIPYEERHLAQLFNDKKADDFVTFKKKKYGKITATDLDNLSVHDISRKLFKAAKAA